MWVNRSMLRSLVSAMIQLIAASQAKRPLAYLTFRDQQLVTSFWKVYEHLKSEKATVKDMCTYLQHYSNTDKKATLFNYILKNSIASPR